ncbi:enoyl-CoA hydratase [Magnetovibrio sp.]|uniref:enoyl-CoA hydratase n=1 Tax=Magnetovibrio sp. TaxID=2024836 RepID=UPI002F95C359
MTFENILTEVKDNIAVITFNRPEALNALNAKMVGEMGRALDQFEADDNVHVIVLTGSEKAFAAGADIKEMANKTFNDAYLGDFISGPWERIDSCHKPVIAAVSGFALGGGCEMAMMCDLIVASETAKFGQPEITLGIVPGIGGTQRLTRAVGKAKAMDMVLTGRMMDAREAESSGLVARVVEKDKLMDEAMAMAKTIASFSRSTVMMAKESVKRSFETTLSEGVRFERRLFHACFATYDQKEGMAAFIEKRKPKFENR